MRVRDTIFVVIALAAMVGLWTQEGSISTEFAFFVRMHSVGYHRYLPRPLVGDVDGDGLNDLIVASQPDRLAFLHPSQAGGHVAVTLEPVKVASFYANIIGMASGFITFPGNHTSETVATTGLWFAGNTGKRHALQGHKRHIAVVTDDYRVSLLASDLVETWSTVLVEPNMMHTVPRQASVIVLPDKIFENDVGLIIVSIPIVTNAGAAEIAVIALNGATGEVRWRHEIGSSATALSTETSDVEAINFKFTEKDLKEHANTRSWTAFREAVIASMPHSFSHPWDGTFVPFRFVHAKNKKKIKAGHRASDRPKEHHSVRSQTRQDDRGPLGQRYDSALHGGNDFKGGGRRQHIRPLPNSVILHSSTGVHYIHLFTGRVITRLQPLQKHVVYDDVNDDLVLDEVRTNIGANQQQFGRHGVDEAFQCLGEIYENFPSSHLLSSTTICDTEGYFSSLGLIRHIVRGDAAEQLSRHLDPLDRIGSKNLADDTTEASTPLVAHVRKPIGRHIYKSERYAIFHVSHGVVTAVNAETNAVIWRADTPSSFQMKSKDVASDAAAASFEVTSPEDRESRLHHFPHMKAYSFHATYDDASDVRNVKASRHQHDPLIVVVGQNHLTLVNTLHGNIEATAIVDRMPIAPTVIADLNGDGVNDLLVTTASGYHGYIVRKHASGTATAITLGVAIAVAALLFVSQYGMNFDAVLGNTAGVEDAVSDADEDDGPILGASTEGLRRRVKRSTD
jgi:hypothetical protein